MPLLPKVDKTWNYPFHPRAVTSTEKKCSNTRVLKSLEARGWAKPLVDVTARLTARLRKKG